MAHETGSGRDIPVAERLVVVEHIVGVELRGLGVVPPVASISLHGVGHPRGGIAARVGLILSEVDTQSGLEAQSVVDVDGASDIAEEAVFPLRAAVLVEQPVGVVLSGHEEGPVLHRSGEGHALLAPAVGAIGLLVIIVLQSTVPAAVLRHVVVAVVGDVDIARHGVHVIDGVHVNTTAGTVLGLRGDVVHRHVDGGAVEEAEHLTEREGVAVVGVVLQHTVGVGVAEGEVGTHHVGAARESDRVVGRDARAVEVVEVVAGRIAQVHLVVLSDGLAILAGIAEDVAVERHVHQQLVVAARGEFVAPAVESHGSDAVHLIDGRAVDILNLGLGERRVEGDVRRHVDAHASLLAFLGGDHQHTVGSHRAIEGCGVGALEHIDRLDVLGVDHRQGIGALTLTDGEHTVGAHLTVLRVGHRHTIHHDERLAGTENRLVASQNDLRRTAGATGTGRDGDTRHLTFERVGEVGVLHAVQVRRTHLLRGIGQRLLLTADTHGGDDHLLEVVALGLHLHADALLAVHRHFLSGVANIGKDKCSLSVGKI